MEEEKDLDEEGFEQFTSPGVPFTAPGVPKEKRNNKDWTEAKRERDLYWLYRMIEGQTNLDLDEWTNLADKLLNTIQDTVASGELVRLVDFGTFQPQSTKPTRKRHPTSGEMIDVPAKVRVKFSPGKGFREKVNRHLKAVETDEGEMVVKQRDIWNAEASIRAEGEIGLLTSIIEETDIDTENPPEYARLLYNEAEDKIGIRLTMDSNHSLPLKHDGGFSIPARGFFKEHDIDHSKTHRYAARFAPDFDPELIVIDLNRVIREF